MIRLGPAGLGGVKEAINSLREYKKKGITACEIAFTYGVYIKNKKDAEDIGKAAERYGIKLSIHAPYYINLNSAEKEKREASKKRILKCCEIGHYLKASYVVFHPGYYGKKSKGETYGIIKKEIKEIQLEIKSKKWKIKIAPETTGKINVFGSVDEILKLKEDTDCHICVDFAHIKARNKGKINYSELFKKIKNVGYLHTHMSGIVYTNKGEKNHIITDERLLKELGEAIKKDHIKNITIINESPSPIKDSIKTFDIFKKLKLKV